MLRTPAGTTRTATAAAVTASCSGAPPALLRLRPPRFGVRLARRQQQQQHGKNRFGIAVRSSEPDATFEELQEQAEEFMRKQSAIETGEEGNKLFSFLSFLRIHFLFFFFWIYFSTDLFCLSFSLSFFSLFRCERELR